MAIDHVAHLRENGELMIAGARRDMDAHVPTCPDWNVGKLVIHTGSHHRWVASAVAGGGDPPGNPSKPGLRGEELLEWFRTGFNELGDLLERTDDATEAWTWSPDGNVGFWRRRTALETLVHRWDAENATGSTTPFDPEIAADCIDEWLTVFIPDAGKEAEFEGPGGLVILNPTDADATWTLALADGSTPEISAGADDGADLTVEATAQQIALMLWGRYRTDVLTLTGDDDLGRALLAWFEK